MDNVAVLVPAYEPDGRLVDYVDSLARSGFCHVVVVDDGSGDEFRGIFDSVEARPFCTVLRHDVNRGKGVALRTGLRYIRESLTDVSGVVTADSDGQHDAEDCRRLADMLEKHEECLLLGSRDFSLPAVPFRSRFGNRWSSITFLMLHGRWLPDTQTGLRAFQSSLIPFMLSVMGDRFEYEMGVLMAAARKGLPIEPVPIRTIYENGNAGTHYRPLVDTLRINRLVFADFIRFSGVSVASFVMDQCLAWMFALMLAAVGCERHGIIWASGFAARILSSVFNYSMNRAFVFRSRADIATSAWKYALLCAAVIVLSNCGVSALACCGVPRGIAKLICDIVLCLAGYRIQARFIFG